MAIQYTTEIRDAKMNQIEATIGVGGGITLNIFTGAAPSATTDANTGTLLVDIVLPNDWLTASSSGTVGKVGTWEETNAPGAGVAAHFRIHETNECHMQGTVGQGSGDLSLDNTTIAATQTVTITQFDLTDGNA